jgi:hypothetical protein
VAAPSDLVGAGAIWRLAEVTEGVDATERGLGAEGATGEGAVVTTERGRREYLRIGRVEDPRRGQQYHPDHCHQESVRDQDVVRDDDPNASATPSSSDS